jgi:hypothetical protein
MPTEAKYSDESAPIKEENPAVLPEWQPCELLIVYGLIQEKRN